MAAACGCRGRRQPDLARLRAQAAPQRDVQALDRPVFVEKVRDIVGLYLGPPDRAIVLCVDEKTQVQALERTQPSAAAAARARPERPPHDYVRHGTTSLFAALDVATGR